MTSPQKPTKSKQLRENFVPAFEKSSFDLQVPKLDPSYSCKQSRSKDRGPGSIAVQDFGHREPLLYVGGTQRAPPLWIHDLPVQLRQLCSFGSTSPSITSLSRGGRISCGKDSRFQSLSAESSRFKPNKCAFLFGHTIFRGMIKDVLDDQRLKSLGRQAIQQ